MADSTNGAAAAPATEGAGQRQVIVNAQYIKDLSFENPRAPQSLLKQQQPPEVALGVDVKANRLAGEVFEVVLTVRAEAKSGSDSIFIVELAYGAVVTLENVGEDAAPQGLLVETPRLMFPFARAIIAQATSDGGFPPLLLHPIDFQELLRRQQSGQVAVPSTTTASA